MKIYFEKTNGGNNVIITDGSTAKVFDGAPSGIFEDVDIYAEDAAAQLRARFQALAADGNLNDYSDIYSSNEIGTDEMEALMQELEDMEAELVFDSAAHELA